MVLPLLHWAPHAGRGCAADQALEADQTACRAGQTELRRRKPLLQKAATAGIAALGLRQSKDLNPLCTIVGPLARPCLAIPSKSFIPAIAQPSHPHTITSLQKPGPSLAGRRCQREG